jgi:hypothetical protein
MAGGRCERGEDWRWFPAWCCRARRLCQPRCLQRNMIEFAFGLAGAMRCPCINPAKGHLVEGVDLHGTRPFLRVWHPLTDALAIITDAVFREIDHCDGRGSGPRVQCDITLNCTIVIMTFLPHDWVMRISAATELPSPTRIQHPVETHDLQTPTAHLENKHRFTIAIMGWFDSLWPSAKSSDPLGSIDPKVRDFLQRESPIKYEARVDAEAKAAQANPEAAAAAAAAAATAATQQTDDKPVVPKESLFQDGRYAHLWKGYRSQGEVENENKTDHEKLMDVLEGFKDRKQLIAQAALENCAIQQDEWINCMKHGDWEDRLQMCRKQVQRFERCYTMQNVSPEGRPCPRPMEPRQLTAATRRDS